MTPFRIAYRHTMPAHEAEGFVQAWQVCKRHLAARGRGLLEAVLLRSAGDPTSFVTVATWESKEAWEAYWSTGVPDPEGDARRKDAWMEVASVRTPEDAAT